MSRALQIGVLVAVVVLAGGWLLVYGGVIRGPAASAIPTLSDAPNPTPTRPTPATPRPSSDLAAPTPSPLATPIDTNVHAHGVVVPVHSADLAMSISGVVSTVYVHTNDQVIGGQLLLKLDQRKYLSDIEVAFASVDQTQAALDAATLRVAQLPTDASPDEISSAQAAVALAQSNHELAASQLTAAQTALRQTELRAPIAGTIASIDVTTGEQATAGQTIVSIGDMSSWLIETTDVSQLDATRVFVGDRATITFMALPDVTITGLVSSVEVRGTAANGDVIFTVTIQPDAFDGRLRWNMSANVSIVPSS
jgi:HlyD family secretion protein